MKKSVAVIGFGLWGRNLVRNFYNLEALHTVCDLDQENLNKVLEQYSDVNTTSDINSVMTSPEIKAIVIATPSHTHYKLVKTALENGKHVYVEKPIATKASEAKELTEIANTKGLALMVGHLLMYHPVVNRLRSIVSNGELGKISYVQSDRLNINYFKNDKSVMWDLAPHDLSMINHILDRNPVDVKSAVGCSSENNNIMDIVHIDVNFEDDILAHITTSWIHPIKRVCLMVVGDKATAVFDDTDPQNKLHIYDNTKPGEKIVDFPDYIEIEPLKLECQHFLSSILNDKKPRSDGNNGYEMVRILEEADKIMFGEDFKKLDELEFVASRTKK